MSLYREESLQDIFGHHDGRLSNKWVHYFKIYEKHLRQYRNTECRMPKEGIYTFMISDLHYWVDNSLFFAIEDSWKVMGILH